MTTNNSESIEVCIHFENHECPNCKGYGFLHDASNIWDCEDCERKGVISTVQLIWADELTARTEKII